MAILVAAIGLVGLLVYRQVDRLRGAVVPVWVAASDLEEGAVLTGENLVTASLREQSLPQATVRLRANIEGRELLRAKKQGESFQAGDLRRTRRDPGPGITEQVPEGRVLMTAILPGFPIAQLNEMLRYEDRFDIFAQGRGEPLHLAHDVIFLGWIAPRQAQSSDNGGGRVGLVDTLTEAANTAGSRGSGPTPLLLGVRPEDVRRLVWALNARVRLSVIIHGRDEVREGKLLPFPVQPRPRAEVVDLIAGSKRRKVSLQK